MGGAAHAHRVQPGGDHVGHHRLPGQNYGEGTRPKPLRQRIGGVRNVLTVAPQPVRRRDVEDERANPKYGILTVKGYLQKAKFAPDTTIELAGVPVGIYE